MEEWKDIEGYEGFYQVSNLGRVRSLDRTIVYSNGGVRHYIGQVLKPKLNGEGYFHVGLSKNGKSKTTKIHKLVAQSFIPVLNGQELFVVDHIDNLKTNNALSNLQRISVRENRSKDIGREFPVGVRFHERRSHLPDPFSSSIVHNGKSVHLGYFKTEESALWHYRMNVNRIENKGLAPIQSLKKRSLPRGVSFIKKREHLENRFKANIRYKGKTFYLGYFKTIKAAYDFYLMNVNRIKNLGLPPIKKNKYKICSILNQKEESKRELAVVS